MANQSVGTIREFKTDNFHIIVDAVEESDLDLSWDEDGAQTRELENGSLIAFCARARVFLNSTGQELASDYLGGCIYESLSAFEDHRECGAANRKRWKQEGYFQIYRKARPYENCLRYADKLKKRGFATRERAEAWAKANAREEYQIFETGRCGSYFAGMVSTVIEEARRELQKTKTVVCGLYVRE
jgi:hypothetical protein